MAGFLTHLLEGQNLSEFQKMSQDGDPKHLGIAGRNLTLIAINERARAEIALAGATGSIIEATEKREADRELAREKEAYNEQAFHERLCADREEAMRRTGFREMPKAQRVKLAPDSDEAVDDFLSHLL